MPTTNLSQRVKRLATLDDAQVQLLDTEGIVVEEDLRMIEFEDIPLGIPVVKRRKLNIISQFLKGGNILNGMADMNFIQTTVLQGRAGNANAGGAQVVVDTNRGAPKIHTNPLPEFSGDAVDYEEWERKSGAIIKQSIYKSFFSSAATAGDAVEAARSMELYNMILSCVGGGHALNTIEKVKDDNNGLECGYLALKALKDWYLDPTQKDAMISHWESKLNTINLDADTSCTEYINNFEMFVRKLTKLGETWTDDKMVREFKQRVDDPDYDTEVRTHTGNFEDLIKNVRRREQDLGRAAAHQSRTNKRNRRFTRDDDDDDDDKKKDPNQGKGKEHSQGKQKQPYIPFIPKFLYNSMSKSTRTNFAFWRRTVNQGETMDKNDLVESEDEGGSSKSGSKKPPNKRPKKEGKKTRRLSKTRRVGLANDTVEVKLTSSDSEYSATDDLALASNRVVTFGDDSKDEAKPGHSVKDVENTSSKRIRMVKKVASIGMSRGRKRHPTYTVIDPGAEQDLIGGTGWHIIHFSDKSEPLGGALQGMGTQVLPKVDAITAMEDEDGKVVLLGFGGVAYDRRITQNESLWNSHHMRAQGSIVDDIAKEVGGTQCMKIKQESGDYVTIPLDFDGSIMTANLRTPSEEELMVLRVIWVLPPMEDITPQSIRRSRVMLKDYQLQVPGEEQSVPEEESLVPAPNVGPKKFGTRTTEEWKELLGFPSNTVIEKTPWRTQHNYK